MSDDKKPKPNGNPLHGRRIVVGGADPETGAPGGTVPAHVEDLDKLKGQYFRNTRTDRYVQIVGVGRAGVLALDCEGPFIPGAGAPHAITWRCLKAIYNIQVSAHEVDGGVK